MAPSWRAVAAEPQATSSSGVVVPHRLTAQLGFGHWYDNTFEAPAGIYTPAVAVGLIPRPWVEARARYTVSLVGLTQPDGTRAHVGFATIEVLFGRELRVSGERIRLGAGPIGGVIHTGYGLGGALGIALAARYLVDLGEHSSLGPMFDVRTLVYRLPDGGDGGDQRDRTNLTARHTDVQVDLGVVLSWW